MWDKAGGSRRRIQDILEIRCKPDYSDYEDLRQHCLMEETCRILRNRLLYEVGKMSKAEEKKSELLALGERNDPQMMKL